MNLSAAKRGLLRVVRIGLRVVLASLIALALMNLVFGVGVESERLGMVVEARHGLIRVSTSTSGIGLNFGPSEAQLPLKPRLERWTFYTPYGVQNSTTGVWVPIWMLSVALLPLIFLIRGPKQFGVGACAECGYAVGGLAAASPCPECGRVGTKIT
jgi:hypothetical protein